jgi:UDP-glucose 4-epimerase
MGLNLQEQFGAKRVLVTGGAGFVGSNIVRRLLEYEASVTVLDNLETGSLDNLAGVAGYRFVKGSVTDFPLIRELVADSEYVVHAAARNIILSTKKPHGDYETNIGGTLNVLLAARAASVRRVVYTSSASVYGNPRYLPVNEDDPPNLLSPYAVSKYAAEGYCRAFYESYGVPATTVRYSNVYGPFQSASNPYCGVIGKFLEAVLRGAPIQIHGDGLQTRDFTYVDDAVQATLLAVVSARAVGQVFNVGTGFETNVNRLGELIMKVLERNVPVRHVDRRDIDNIRRRVLNIERIRGSLRWTPQVTLAEGLRRTAEWFVRREATASGAVLPPCVSGPHGTMSPDAFSARCS